MLFFNLKEEGYIDTLEEFSHLTIAQIKLFAKASKKVADLERINKKLNKEMKKEVRIS